MGFGLLMLYSWFTLVPKKPLFRKQTGLIWEQLQSKPLIKKTKSLFINCLQNQKTSFTSFVAIYVTYNALAFEMPLYLLNRRTT